MANEANINTGTSIASAMQSLADLGTIQVNLVVKGIETLTPVAGSLAKTMTDVLAASFNLLASTTGAAVGIAASAGGTILNAMGIIALAPVKVLGNVAGILISTAQSGVSFAINAVGSIVPGRKAA